MGQDTWICATLLLFDSTYSPLKFSPCVANHDSIQRRNSLTPIPPSPVNTTPVLLREPVTLFICGTFPTTAADRQRQLHSWGQVVDSKHQSVSEHHGVGVLFRLPLVGWCVRPSRIHLPLNWTKGLRRVDLVTYCLIKRTGVGQTKKILDRLKGQVSIVYWVLTPPVASL